MGPGSELEFCNLLLVAWTKNSKQHAKEVTFASRFLIQDAAMTY